MRVLAAFILSIGLLISVTGCPSKNNPSGPTGPTATPTETFTIGPSSTSTATPTETSTLTVTGTSTSTNSPTGTGTFTLTATPTETLTATPSPTPTATVSDTPTETETPTITMTPTNTACVSGCISTIAGRQQFGYNGDGAATIAMLYRPSQIAHDASGGYFIADSANHRVRRVDSSGNLTTVAGTGTGSYNGDGIAATSAQLYSPFGVAYDWNGGFYITERQNNRVRQVDSLGTISTVAGTGTEGFGGSGVSAVSVDLRDPIGIAVDFVSGDFYFAEYGTDRIRKVSNGIITTVAGTGSPGYNGDSMAATLAELNGPTGICLDTVGNLYIADYRNHRVRRVDATTGNISTVAGTGTGGYNGDGITATSAQLNYPASVALDPSGKLLIVDQSNHRVRRVASGVISTVAGTGTGGYNGDGVSAVTADLNFPFGVLPYGVSGGFYISDSTNNRVRQVTP